MIDSDLVVRIDVEAFEHGVAAARASAAIGDTNAARTAYHEALVHYRDDLLTELPYEEWTVLRREQLRVRMLDALSYIAEKSFEIGSYQECIDAGQRLVATDLCREDVHRLLMRAHARLEQPHRAMRQYRACQRQLANELGLGPSPNTVRLFDLIRSRKPV
jgi:DNA-binding SARP family transcriptional activator